MMIEYEGREEILIGQLSTMLAQRHREKSGSGTDLDTDTEGEGDGGAYTESASEYSTSDYDSKRSSLQSTNSQGLTSSLQDADYQADLERSSPPGAAAAVAGAAAVGGVAAKKAAKRKGDNDDSSSSSEGSEWSSDVSLLISHVS